MICEYLYLCPVSPGYCHPYSIGPISHGFAPKTTQQAGNISNHPWIPTVFDTLSKEAMQQLGSSQLWYYERPGWTFHAKGLWLYYQNNDLAATICGSGNYGARSETLDMESNCVLVLPQDSPLQARFQQEWDDMMEHSKQATMNKQQQQQQQQQSSSLAWPLQVCLPIIRKFL